MNGTNYQNWSQPVKIALRNKVKLQFLNGSVKPDSKSPLFNQLIKYDSMAVNWLLNLTAPKLSEPFMFVECCTRIMGRAHR